MRWNCDVAAAGVVVVADAYAVEEPRNEPAVGQPPRPAARPC